MERIIQLIKEDNPQRYKDNPHRKIKTKNMKIRVESGINVFKQNCKKSSKRTRFVANKMFLRFTSYHFFYW